MFSNFIYFIIVLLIYVTYPPAQETNFSPVETLVLFIGLIAVFAGMTRWQFYRVEKLMLRESFSYLDHKFNVTLTRQFVMAIVVFAIDIYGLNLTAFITHPFFAAIPTLQALVFLLLFTFYLAIVWAYAYNTYQKLYPADMDRGAYVLSNILFSVPVLLPWLLLSGIADIINALPFEGIKAFLATTEGEILYFFTFLIIVAMVGPLLIRHFWRCKPLSPGYDRIRIENLCQRADLEYANILYWPIFGGKMITAGVMGLIKRFRYILVTEGLLRYLDPEEVDAVIAHEIGHVKKKHFLFYLFFFVGYMLLSYATFDLTIYAIIYIEPMFRWITTAGLNQSAVTSAIFSLVTILIFVIYFRYIFGYFMRNFERQADAYVYTLFDTAMPLISTFEKITVTSGQRPDKPNWHHFSITERIGYLEKCEADRTWIRRQDQKIKKSIVIYLAAMVLVGAVGYHLNFGEAGRKLSRHFFEKAVSIQIEKNPDDPALCELLGDIYYDRKNYEGTVRAYEKSLRLKPDNSHVLNNLAWLYATCEDEKFRNPEKALELAEKAAVLEPAPHILDTLAESYYVNGRFEDAVSAEKRALELVKDDRSHYEAQLRKFTEASRELNETDESF